MEQNTITSEQELAEAVLQLIDQEISQVTGLPRLQALYRIKRGGDLDEDLSRCGATLEALFKNNAMSGGGGASYTFGRSRGGVPQIERVQENANNSNNQQNDVNFPGFHNGQPPFPFVPLGVPGPFIPMQPGMYFAPPPQPLFAPRQPPAFQPRQPPPEFKPRQQPQEFKPQQQEPQEFQPRQQTQTPQPPAAEPAKFVRMSQLYKMVNDQVNQSKNGRISIEMLFDNFQDVLKEQNLILNQIQTSDWTGVIERGIDSQDIEAVLTNGLLYKPGSAPQNVAPVVAQSAPPNPPAPVTKPSFGERNLVSEMQQHLRIDERSGPLPFNQAAEGHRQFNNQSKLTEKNQGFSQSMLPFASSSGESLVNTTTNSSSYSDVSRSASRFSAPVTNFPVGDDHIKEEKIRGRIIWDYIQGQLTCYVPQDEAERVVLAKAVNKCRKLWGKRMHELAEVIFLLKSHWLRQREIVFTDLGHTMFDFIFGTEGELDWGRLGLTPDDLAPLRLYESADRVTKTVQVNEYIQLVSIYQIAQGSLPAQVYKMLMEVADGEAVYYNSIIRNTRATCQGGWQAMNNQERYFYLEEELFNHKEIFTLNTENGYVQLRHPMAHLVVC